MEHSEKKANKGILFLMIVVISLMWGTSFLALKLALRWLEPIQVLTARWTVAAAFFLIAAAAGKLRLDPRRPDFKFLMLTALIEPCLYSIFETYAVDLTSASTSAIFIATIPCVVLVLQFLITRKKVKASVLLGILTAFAGVFICTYFSPGFSLSGQPLGFLMLVMTVLMGALYGIVSPMAARSYSSFEITAMMAFAGCAAFHVENLLLGDEAGTFITLGAHPQALALCVYLGLGCSVLCYSLFNHLMASMDTAVANNMTANSVTAVGVLAGVLLLGDPGGWYTLVGLAVTITGVLLSSRGE